MYREMEQVGVKRERKKKSVDESEVAYTNRKAAFLQSEFWTQITWVNITKLLNSLIFEDILRIGCLFVC